MTSARPGHLPLPVAGGPHSGLPVASSQGGAYSQVTGNFREESYQLARCGFTKLQGLSQAQGQKLRLAVMQGTSRERVKGSLVLVTTENVTGNSCLISKN